jgi:hypothetical protein
VLVVSDHGMSNIENFIELELEKQFGRPSASSYAYFTEGTILRIWCHSPELGEAIDAYLREIQGVARLTDDERLQQGITQGSFGDLIYYSEDGYQFVPSFWGPKPSVGMHGHHPANRSQHGVVLSTRQENFPEQIGARDFYKVLESCLTAI